MTDPREGLRERVEKEVDLAWADCDRNRVILPRPPLTRTESAKQAKEDRAHRIHAIYAPHLSHRLSAKLAAAEAEVEALKVALDKRGAALAMQTNTIEYLRKKMRAPLTDEEREALLTRLGWATEWSAEAYGGHPEVKRWREGDRIIREHFGLSETEGSEG